MAEVKVVELGCPGHFICAKDCRWRRHTQVGNRYRVSTVGDLYFNPPPNDLNKPVERQTIGGMEGEFFETMVFSTLARRDPDSEGCGCRQVKDWSGLECVRYATAGEAQKGHERMVRKYKRRVEKDIE